ncbi:aspartic proteinase cdr1 [Phtheirospermum japonicum]|uniref:Aspartic proteinase cdr1 n=1 Tax=Phtheirospermum japonicum TaxID=374723 RepID=A0A830AWN3_9LAMI|nr:aspartic proteinase cdr1 [Phtheirospermum japonicum]
MANLKTCQFTPLFLHILLFFFNGVYSNSSGFTLELIPWDSPESPLYQTNLTQTQKIQMMAIASKERASISPIPENRTLEANKIQIPLKNKGLRYSVNIKIGSQGTKVTLLMDTGSGPIWTHCNDTKSTFNPKRSKTYKHVHCQHPLCQKAKDKCKCIQGLCLCTVEYGSDGVTKRILAVLSADSFTLPLRNKSSRTFPDIIFGCSTPSPIFSGILGMDKLPVSLISQVRENVQGRYSYCLHSGNGYLKFGNDIPPVGRQVQTTEILYPWHPTMHLGLTDISVAGRRLGLSPYLFSMAQGGFFTDTGSPLTVLNRQAYDRVIQAFATYYNGRLKRVKKNTHHLDLCYKHNSSMKSYISMTFHLQGADYVTSNLFVFPERGIMCIGLMPGELSILGAMMQYNKRFIFDINRNVMQFVDEDCSKDRG